jgi:hypothetical protein
MGTRLPERAGGTTMGRVEAAEPSRSGTPCLTNVRLRNRCEATPGER